MANETEAGRIRAAIDRIGQLPGDDAHNCWLLLTQFPYYNPELRGKIKVNRSASEDEMSFAATHNSITGDICLHHSYVTGDRWDRWGVDGLALLLFSEWPHIEQPYWSERQCQEWLQRWR